MDNKGFAEKQTSIETPNGTFIAEKPLNPKPKRPKRVDINVLKSKLQEHQNRELKKNMIVFISFLIGIGSVGLYLSI